jgi:transposase-like protein
MQGLSNEQNSLLSDQTRGLSRTRNRIQDCLDGLNRAIGAANLNPQRVSEMAGDLAQAMETWQKQYQRLGEDMGVRSGREGS